MAQRARGAAAGGSRPADRSRASDDVRPYGILRSHGPPALRPQELAGAAGAAALGGRAGGRGEGLDLEDLSVTRAGRRYVVRVTVDGDGGIGHDELSDVSREISAALDEAEQRAAT